MKRQSDAPPKAAALKYDGKNAPKVVAKGSGELAQKIIAIAEQNDVHIHHDPYLTDVLSRLELGDEIPEQLYLAVAKIIAFAYFIQGKHPEFVKKKSPLDETAPILSSEHFDALTDETDNEGPADPLPE